MCRKVVIAEHHAKALLDNEYLVVTDPTHKLCEDHAHAVHVVVTALACFLVCVKCKYKCTFPPVFTTK